MKYLFLILAMGLSQKTEIDGNILNSDFSKYENENFIMVTQENCEYLDVSPKYSYYYPSDATETFTFLRHRVSDAAFKVENDSIREVKVTLEVFDIDKFYKEIAKKYGEASSASISKKYLEEHGFKVPTETDNFNENAYDQLSLPQIKDYKNLRYVIWSNVANSETSDTYMVVRNRKSVTIMDTEVHDVEVLFRKEKEY